MARTPWADCARLLSPLTVQGLLNVTAWVALCMETMVFVSVRKTTFMGQALKSAAVLVCNKFSKIFFLCSIQ